MNKDLEYYVNLPWIVQIEYVTDDTKTPYYFARDLMLTGCMGDGETAADAVADIWDARRDMLKFMLKKGDPIPEPCGHMIALPAHATITSTGSIE